MPDLSIWEAWVLGNYDTCSFFNQEGRQAFGVCCTNPIQSTPPSIMDDYPSKDNNYPNWPPPLPTHPPDHAAPTHPPVSGSLPSGINYPTLPSSTTMRPHRPITTWPTRPITQYPQWPPSAATHPNPVFTTTLAPLDNEIPVDGSCGAKNGLSVLFIIKFDFHFVYN